jgi:hypothetical protein
MNLPRDLVLAHFAPSVSEGAGAAWSASEACLRRYGALLEHPHAELLMTLALRRAAARLRGEGSRDDDTRGLVKAALVELHRLLEEPSGEAGQPSPQQPSLRWCLQRWTHGEAVLRSAPSIQLGHMVPEGFSRRAVRAIRVLHPRSDQAVAPPVVAPPVGVHILARPE